MQLCHIFVKKKKRKKNHIQGTTLLLPQMCEDFRSKLAATAAVFFVTKKQAKQMNTEAFQPLQIPYLKNM